MANLLTNFQTALSSADFKTNVEIANREIHSGIEKLSQVNVSGNINGSLLSGLNANELQNLELTPGSPLKNLSAITERFSNHNPLQNITRSQSSLTAAAQNQQQSLSQASLVDTEFGNLQGAIDKQSQQDAMSMDASGVANVDLDSGYEGRYGEETNVGPESDNPFNAEGIPNPLHDLSSYTYNLSLHMIDSEVYNSIMKTGQYTTQNVLIAGAGRYEQRLETFKDVDFYFDKMKFETIVGANQRSMSSNVISFEFTIIEPNGVTLLNRIIASSAIVAKDKQANYLEVPYLLQLEFTGYDDNGTPLPNNKLSRMTKYFPIKIIGMKIKVSQKGAEYQIQAIPYNHHGFTETIGTVPVDLAVTGDTVGTFFRCIEGLPEEERAKGLSQESKLVEEFNQREQDLNERNKRFQDARNNKADEATLKKIGSEHINNMFQTSSFTDAFNAYLTTVSNLHKWKTSDRIEIHADADIANSEIANRQTITIQQTAFRKENTQTDPGKSITTNPAVQINAGTSILKAIETVMLSSKYIRDQIHDINDKRDIEKIRKDLEKCKERRGWINWYKVIPEVRLGEYDVARREYSKVLIYHIKPYKLHNNALETAPLGLPSTVQKSYNYIFTGKNDDILDFQIDFDALYYTAKTAITGLAESTNISKDDPIEANKISETDKQLTEDIEKCYKSLETEGDRPKTVHTPIDKAVASNISGSSDTRAVHVNDLKKSLMSSARGDMINVRLKILGDPHFIKQDDFFFNPGGSYPTVKDPITQTTFTLNGSITTDTGTIYAFLTFKTPVDFDPDTGLNVKGTESLKYVDSMFNGIYKVIRVENTFSNGKFEQVLDLIRMPNQESKLRALAESQREVENALTGAGRSNSTVGLAASAGGQTDPGDAAIGASSVFDTPALTPPGAGTFPTPPGASLLENANLILNPGPRNFGLFTADPSAPPTVADHVASITSGLTPEQESQKRQINSTVNSMVGVKSGANPLDPFPTKA